MSYNTKNYTEQGGEKTVIGGTLEIKEGASVTGLPSAPNQAASTATNVAGLKDDLNALLLKLKDTGLMKPDTWNVSAANVTSALSEDMTANQGKVESITIEDNVITVTVANNEIGTIQPIKKIAEIAHQHGAYMHTDAVQAVGHIPVNVQDLCVDLLSASAHKFHGPKGVGFLYIRKGTNILPYIDGGAQEKRFRAGTENVAGIVGMAVALKNCVSQMQKEAERLKIITERFYSELDKFGIDYVINGDKNKRLPGNINISIKHSNGEMLLHRLDLKGIYISTGAACDSKETKLSHVIEAIQVPKEYAEGTLRISFGRENTVDDSVTIAAAISAIVR